MIKFVCDKCGTETKDTEKHQYSAKLKPENWIYLDCSFEYTNNRDEFRKMIHCNQELHFCSKGCFYYYFFKTPK